jgi:hypothetical protein
MFVTMLGGYLISLIIDGFIFLKYIFKPKEPPISVF